MKKAFLTVMTIITIGFLSNNLFAQTTPPAPAAAPAATGSADLVATLSGNPDYEAMAVAIRAANLGATLKGAGPYTIFAPNNIAFSNLSSGKLDSLMADPVKLAAVIKGHVAIGKYDKATILKSLTPTASLKTLDGQTLTLGVSEKHLQITDAQGNKAKVVAFDILGTNGVIIGLDAVLTK